MRARRFIAAGAAAVAVVAATSIYFHSRESGRAETSTLPVASVTEFDAALAAAAPGETSTFRVATVTEFDAAIAAAASGDTIILADGQWKPLKVRRKDITGEPVTIRGSRGARVSQIGFNKSSNFVLSGFTVTPPGIQRARIEVEGRSSHSFVIERVLVDGRDSGDGCAGAPRRDTDGDGRRDTCPPGFPAVGGALIDAKDATNVVVRDSTFTKCGKRLKCLTTNPSMKVLNNTFRENYSAAFIKGGGGVIRGNTFGYLGHGDCSEQTLPDGSVLDCPHYSQVSINGQGPWFIEGNRFAVQEGGSAVVSQTIGANVTLTVNLVNNIFPATLPEYPGKASRYSYAVRFGSGRTPEATPRNSKVLHNTFLYSGKASVYIPGDWTPVPRAEQPLVANNILFRQKRGCSASARAGRWVSNVVITADPQFPCAGLEQGVPNLDAKYRPQEPSPQVIGAADPAYASRLDFCGKPRVAAPDRGAVETQGC